MKAPCSLTLRSLNTSLQLSAQAIQQLQSQCGIQSASRAFASTPSKFAIQSRVLDPFRTPPHFHDALRLASSNNALLLALFTTSACAPCRTITPLLTSLVTTRVPKPDDKFAGLFFAELELDSPDTSNGNMMEMGVEWGVTSLPTLIGYGGRRAERVTDRVTDTRFMCDRKSMEAWVDGEMAKGDPFPSQGGSGGGGGMLSKFFG